VGIITLLVIGLIVGLLGRAVLPGRQALPLWLTMVIGVGSLLLAGALIPAGLIVEVIVGTVIAAAIIALTHGGVRSRARL
jgi:uncharacterized membrane protein YeaQ/YmgE (transglycosylase-associated protein family)